jgi:DNA-binding XRE family transcriptional regulator
MSAPTDIQIIKQNGHPAFVVIPYDEYIKVFPEKPWIPENDLIPHEVVGMVAKRGFTLIRAWREHLNLTQKEVAENMGISQAALSQMESGEKKLRKATLEKLAMAMGLSIEQIRE